MLYYVTQLLKQYVSGFNFFRYITVRSGLAVGTALLTSLLLGPLVIAWLTRLKIGQNIRTKEAPALHDLHKNKAGTPTMGGVLIVAATFSATLLWANIANRLVWLALGVVLWLGLIGFLDDYIKLKKKQSLGLRALPKFAGQLMCGLVLGIHLYYNPVNLEHANRVDLLMLKDLVWNMGAFYILSVYAIYLAIGIGLIRILLYAGLVRIISRVLGGFIIGLSLLTLANSLGQRIPLKLPRESIVLIPTRLTGSWISKSPIIAAMLFGGVVTALEFPCTGGIYVAIVGTLAVHGANLSLIAYLLAYNLMFVLPLVILLILLCTVGRFRWMMKAMEQHRHILEGVSAFLMLALGILLFF